MGNGVKEDVAKALKWYRKAFDLGYAGATKEQSMPLEIKPKNE